MSRYEALTQQMDPRMLAGDPTRVALVREALHRLGEPDGTYRSIHLAGTNGKGSTAAFIAQTLQNAKLLVGQFTSPVMGPAYQQILIGGEPLTEAQYVKALTAIQQHLEVPLSHFSQFEWDVLVMFQVFADRQVAWAVIEAGLGGQNDATNALTQPDLVVFTHIALDHTTILGPDLTHIARNKAGIIKAGVPVVVAPDQPPAALTVLKAAATGHDWLQAPQLPLGPQTLQGTKTRLPDGSVVTVRMLGAYQLANAATAYTVAQWLVQSGVLASLAPLVAALETVQLPGRLQLIGHHPPVLVDVSHNPDGLAHALAAIQAVVPGHELVVIAGFLADKDVAVMVGLLDAAATTVYTVTPQSPRALSGAALARQLARGQASLDPQTALAKAQARATEQTVILITGSFYVAKMVLPHD